MNNNGIVIEGNQLGQWNSHQIDDKNKVNDKSVYYYKNMSGWKAPSNAGQVILANTSNIEISNLSIVNASIGIGIGFSSGILVSNNSILYSSSYGIYLQSSNDSNLSHNQVTTSSTGYYRRGISLTASTNNIIINNMVNNGYIGILLALNSYFNKIVGNTVSSNDYGIWLSQSANGNTMIRNDIIANTVSGLNLSFVCINNHLHHNNLINNAGGKQAWDDSGNNYWNDTTKGNYWSNYDTPAEGCYDTDSNGICDSPYSIPGGKNAKDFYPITTPVVIEFRGEEIALLFMIVTVLLTYLIKRRRGS
jgi:parallel beta-helix repeat protein